MAPVGEFAGPQARPTGWKICYDIAMSSAMYCGILVLLYCGYLALGIFFKFPVGYLDWHAPYAHLGLLGGETNALLAFALPGVLFLWTAMVWYRKSMIGEA